MQASPRRPLPWHLLRGNRRGRSFGKAEAGDHYGRRPPVEGRVFAFRRPGRRPLGDVGGRHRANRDGFRGVAVRIEAGPHRQAVLQHRPERVPDPRGDGGGRLRASDRWRRPRAFPGAPGPAGPLSRPPWRPGRHGLCLGIQAHRQDRGRPCDPGIHVQERRLPGPQLDCGPGKFPRRRRLRHRAPQAESGR